MASAVVPIALLVAVLNAVAAALGAWRWWRVLDPDPWFWRAVRAGQASAVFFAAFAGVLAATGHEPGDGLFWLYALLPLAVAFVGEQLRVAAAASILAQHDLAGSAAVGRLPEQEQRGIVIEIVRREIGVMALSALVVSFLALRAAGTAHGF